MKFNIKDYDILGIKPTIYVEGNKRKLSTLGGILSIFTVLIFITAIVYFFCEVFVRTNFSLIYNQTTDYKPILNLTNLPLAFGFLNASGNIIPIPEVENYLNVYGEFKQMIPISKETGEFKINSQVFLLENCDLDAHFGIYSNFFSYIPNLNQFYCFPNRKMNFTLYGNLGDAFNPNSFITIKISKCLKNSNEIALNFTNKNCLNKTLIDIKLNTFYLNALSLDYDIDHNNFENPAKLIVKTETFSFSSSVFNRYHKLRKIIKYYTDYGVLFSNSKNDFFFQDDSTNLYTDLRVNNSPVGSLGQLIFSLSQKTDNYFRIYKKIQSAIASIGGLLQGIWWVAISIIRFFNRKSYYSQLGKRIYKISDDNVKNLNLTNYSKNFYANFENENNNQNKISNYFSAHYFNDIPSNIDIERIDKTRKIPSKIKNIKRYREEMENIIEDNDESSPVGLRFIIKN